MPVSYRPLPTISESADDLEARLRAERDPARKQRLRLLLLLERAEVTSQARAADHLGVHRNTVSDWLGRYRAGGLDAMLTLGPPGRPAGQRTLPEPVFEALQRRLDDPEGFGGYDHIQTWLAEEFGLGVPYQSVYTLVRYRLGAKLKTPRPEHPKKTSRRPPASPSGSGVTSA